jgi:hypothetical protein
MSFFHFHHVCDAISLFNAESDLSMMWIVRVVFVGHEPLIDSKYATWFQDTEDFGIHAFEAGRVASRFNGVDGVEAIVWKW